MEPKLPQGLVAMSSVSASEILQQGTLSNGLYKNLWQAYSTSHLASKDETERRLEHLFWRIWGAKRLSSRVNTRTLNRLILRIKAPAILVGQRVTVPPLPVTGDKGENVNINAFYIAPYEPRISDSCARINKNQPGCAVGASSPPLSIVRKSQPSQVETYKATRLLLDTPIGTKITLNPSNSPTTSMAGDHTSTSTPGNTGRQRRQKTLTDAKSTLTPEKVGGQDSKKTSIASESATAPIDIGDRGSKKTFLTAPKKVGDQDSKKTSMTSESTTALESLSQHGPKKTYLTATRHGRGPRRRPVFNHRKSSQVSIPRTAIPTRRRSEPTTKADDYEDSYVELGLLQHLSFRDEDDEITRNLGYEIAPAPKPAIPSFSPFDDDDFVDDPVAEEAIREAAATSPIPFPRASTLRRPMLSPEEVSKVKPLFKVVKNPVKLPGGPQFDVPGDIEGDWADIC
ncbi:hypothetical protein DTO013E5_5311 [Penicillium roqueforti]|uniref:Genomic scaffold, ProqFM164S01 n=1 Tax=Penicillium roqueforti (strain FM164) TaxID=1365484 RepID=W6PZ87_PENRF|nr:uncharacterized protein LCP9604111_5440 [Penicillium roqueforti]CDM29335.1 unnamed protein product [Penicillium roqueforti FM164]KAF9248185.1 hypothetical protein LCP9604111_5440 [Penicillium roqueforti]KAI2676892.1 hypothetical protein LCP963914a_8187 [Penicillium roqueforti]KAI2683064.1 hypothetical protein CBS147355_2204 [Penicillium roqueforti]KAI2715014.1 hypothetical protein CBS147354_7263 [Penicillium roqueforti]